jgi:hypothetical protein
MRTLHVGRLVTGVSDVAGTCGADLWTLHKKNFCKELIRLLYLHYCIIHKYKQDVADTDTIGCDTFMEWKTTGSVKKLKKKR